MKFTKTDHKLAEFTDPVNKVSQDIYRMPTFNSFLTNYYALGSDGAAKG